jgi:hypothetical protein
MLRTAPAFLLLLAAPAAGQAPPLVVTGGKLDQTNAVVFAPLPKNLPAGVNVVELPDGQHAPAQVVNPPLVGGQGKALAFVLPKLPAGGSVSVRPGVLTYVKAPPQFAFKQATKEYADLTFDGKKVLRYMNAPRDASTKDTHELTFKPFHHVYDPATGETLLTNGAGLAADKANLFPHHRGLFFAFNKVSYGDQKDVDVWHGKKNEFTLHEATASEEAGEVLGRHRAKLSWHGRGGEAFADELREVTAYHVPGGTLLDWQTVLTTTLPKVRLDGDPQHAGFHFRAAMEVSKNGKQETYYLRPDGKGKMGEERNWDAKGKNSQAVNLPWNAVSFVVGGKRYTVVRCEPPRQPEGNPRQRAVLRPVRRLLRVRPDPGHAAEVEVPGVGARGRDDRRPVRRPGRRVRQPAEGRPVAPSRR